MYIHVTRKTGLVTNIKTADGQTDTQTSSMNLKNLPFHGF